MKFGREFKEALRQEGYPAHWIDSAVPYGQLKKCLKKVQQELLGLGLDPDTLQQLFAAHTVSEDGDQAPLAKYNFDVTGSREMRPRLTVTVHLEDGVAVDASLSPSSKAFLERVAAQEKFGTPAGSSDESTGEPVVSEKPASPPPEEAKSPPHDDQHPNIDHVEVPLVFDNEFFGILRQDVENLDTLQRQEQEGMTSTIVELGKDMTEVTKPSRYHKSDLSRWREIFELYLDAQVFFSNAEQNRGARKSETALKHMVWFQNEVNKRNLAGRFKLPASQQAFGRFVELNAKLLQNLKFQEINRTAITKILKKFDKRTSLGVKEIFPVVIHSERFMVENVAKDVCAQMSRDVVSTVPRLDDYMCPVCMSIAWLPVRLNCRHVFCVRCVIKMQRDEQSHCPLCREDGVMKADLDNLDPELEKFLKRYFRKETREKQKANEIERGIEMYGESYKPSTCTIM